MGYGYTTDAGRVLDRIDAQVRKEAEARGEKPSNVYQDAKGNRYFYEVARKDQPDGGIRGSIHKFVGENLAKRVGGFHITGDGRVMNAPGHFYALLEASVAARPAAPRIGLGGRMGVW